MHVQSNQQSKAYMKTYAYIVPIDDGAAPNPYGGVCTLAICKPNLRKVAQEGDWVLGFVNSEENTSERLLLYAMKVTKVLSMSDYDAYTKDALPIKIPDIKSTCLQKQMGDSVYDFSVENVALRPSVHSLCTKEMDLDGKNVLLSEYFYYFGSQSRRCSWIKKEQLRDDEDYFLLKKEVEKAFFNWLETAHLEINKVYAKPHRIGIVPSSTAHTEKSCCIRKKIERPFWKK